MNNCPRCGASVTPEMNNCPYCGLQLKEVQNVGRKASRLSIVALVLGILSVTAFLGFIIGLIDLIRGNKEDKHYGSWIAIIWFGIIFIVGIFSLDNESQDYKDNNTNQIVQESQASTQANNQAQSKTNDNNNYTATYSNVVVKYLRDEFVIDSYGDELYLVYYQVTNNSDKAKAFTYTFDDKAYLNGVELEKEYFYNNQYYKNYSLEVMPGNTLTVVCPYKMRNETGKMNIQLRPFMGSTLLLDIQLNVTSK